MKDRTAHAGQAGPRRWAFKIGYLSDGFYGYARQPGKPTVEGLIVDELARRKVFSGEKSILVASRTDKGVHALGNVIAFDTPLNGDAAARVLGSMDDRIFCFGFAPVDTDFDPRDALERWYRYLIPAKGRDQRDWDTWAGEFEGLHEFSSFSRKDTPPRTTERTVRKACASMAGPYLAIDIVAPSFLWGQVRKIVAALDMVADRRLTIGDLRAALSGAKRLTLPLAPAERLSLMDVTYPFDFTPNTASPARRLESISLMTEALQVRATLLDGFRERIANGPKPFPAK